jgi:hypothetical protein
MIPIILQMTGYNNKKMTVDQFANTIDYVISILVDPQPRINIANITPAGAPTTPAGAPTTPPSTPARGAHQAHQQEELQQHQQQYRNEKKALHVETSFRYQMVCAIYLEIIIPHLYLCAV